MVITSAVNYQIDFNQREGEPLLQKYQILGYATLHGDQLSYNQLFLRQNTYQTFDGLINLEWPSQTGTFYDVGDKLTFSYSTLKMRPNLLYVYKMNLDNYKQEHQRQVYNLLDLLGDLGGVLEVLVFIFGIFLYPISEHSFTMKALSILYLARTEKKNVFSKPIKTQKKIKNLKTKIP